MAASVTRLVINTAIAATISTSYARQVGMILSLYYVHVIAVNVWNFLSIRMMRVIFLYALVLSLFLLLIKCTVDVWRACSFPKVTNNWKSLVM